MELRCARLSQMLRDVAIDAIRANAMPLTYGKWESRYHRARRARASEPHTVRCSGPLDGGICASRVLAGAT
jgi:hypothetical protein